MLLLIYICTDMNYCDINLDGGHAAFTSGSNMGGCGGAQTPPQLTVCVYVYIYIYILVFVAIMCSQKYDDNV